MHQGIARHGGLAKDRPPDLIRRDEPSTGALPSNAIELGMSLELVGLDTYNLDSDLCALQLRCRFRDLKENEKVTRQIKLHGLRRMNRLMFLGLLRTQQA